MLPGAVAWASVNDPPKVGLARAGEARVAGDAGGHEDVRGLRPQAADLRQVVRLGFAGGLVQGFLLDGRASRFLLRLGLDLVVGDDLLAAELLDRRCHERLKRRGGLGREGAVDEQRVVRLDRVLDGTDRPRPVALVLDEEGARAFLDLACDLLHELVIDADVAEAVVQAGEDAAGSATDHGSGRSEQDRPDDDADRATPDAALQARRCPRSGAP